MSKQVQRSITGRFARESRRSVKTGTLGKIVGTARVIETGKPNIHYVTLDDGTVTEAINLKVSHLGGNEIRIEVKPGKGGRYEVIGLDTERALDTLGAAAAAAGTPAHSHNILNTALFDPVSHRRILEGLVYHHQGDDPLLLRIAGFPYDGGSSYFPDNSINLSAPVDYRPTSADTKRWVKVGIDLSTNLPLVAAGPEMGSTVLTGYTDLVGIAFSGLALFGVLLRYGQTTTPALEDFLDLRPGYGDTADADHVVEGRLTLTTATPITTADVTAATTLYFTPYKGNRIALYNGARWKTRTFTERSIAIPSTTNTLYDVFIYDDAGTLTLELVAWNSPTNGAITGATNATPIVVTYTGTDPANDQIVTIVGVLGNTAANGTWRIGNINTGAKTFALWTLANNNSVGNGAYTSGGTWQRSDQNTGRATALAIQDGVRVKTGATTRLYLGTIRTTTTGGQCEDSGQRRYVSNHYNQVKRRLLLTDVANSHTYATSAWRPWANTLADRVEFIEAVTQQPYTIMVIAEMRGQADGNLGYVSLALDVVNNSGQAVVETANNQYVRFTGAQELSVGGGYHFLQIVEYVASGTCDLNIAEITGSIIG